MTKKYKWEIFPGRNRFCCNGRIITAKSLSLFYLTLFLILFTFALFISVTAIALMKFIGPVIVILAVILFAFTMSCFFHTAFSDPGIIPRARPDEAAYTEQFIIDQFDNGTNHQRSRPPPRTKEILINGQPVKIKYCFTCQMFRPPRASHCSVCDNCVDCFDHHCPWVGNCVGRRNYRYFYMFILSFSLLCIFVLACSLTHILLLSKETSFFEACLEAPVSVVVFLICFISIWSILGLAGFHTFLTAGNLTTNEDIKGTYGRSSSLKNPYSGSIFKNCYEALCSSTPISLIDPQGVLSTEEQIGRGQNTIHRPAQPYHNQNFGIVPSIHREIASSNV